MTTSSFSDFPNLQAQHHRRREVFCIHGRLGPGRPAATTPIVLTRREFDSAYDPWGSSLHSFIQQTILAHDLCFLGCNPAEPYLARILESCKRHCQAEHGLTSNARPQWYLLADEGYEQLDAATDCGIRVVQYDKRDSQFTGMDSVLEYWANKKPPFLRQAGVQESSFKLDVEPGQMVDGFFAKLKTVKAILSGSAPIEEKLARIEPVLADDDVQREFWNLLDDEQWVSEPEASGYLRSSSIARAGRRRWHSLSVLGSVQVPRTCRWASPIRRCGCFRRHGDGERICHRRHVGCC